MSTRSVLVRGGVAALAVVVSAGLAGCGAGSSASDAATPTNTAAPQAGGGRGLDPALRQKIVACLQAAGLPVPSARARPTDIPTPDQGAPPTREPGQGRGPGGVGGEFATPQVRAALQACGITLPTRQPGAGGAPPTA